MGKIGGLRPGVMQNLEFAVFVGAKRAVIEKRGSADGGERSERFAQALAVAWTIYCVWGTFLIQYPIDLKRNR